MRGIEINMDLADNDRDEAHPTLRDVKITLAEPLNSRISPGIYIEHDDFQISVISQDGYVKVVVENTEEQDPQTYDVMRLW